MVLPRMVYISDATELGTIYTKAELAALYEVCREYGSLPVPRRRAHGRGAGGRRATTCSRRDFCNVLRRLLHRRTKNGLLFGEAVVITNDALKPHFRNMIKQRGGMFAKGFPCSARSSPRICRTRLWLTMARHAVTQAQRIQTAAVQKGYRLFAVAPPTRFVVLSHAQIEQLRRTFAF